MPERFPDGLEAALHVALLQVGITAENKEDALLTVCGPNGIRVITKASDKSYRVDPVEEVEV